MSWEIFSTAFWRRAGELLAEYLYVAIFILATTMWGSCYLPPVGPPFGM